MTPDETNKTAFDDTGHPKKSKTMQFKNPEDPCKNTETPKATSIT